MYIKNSFSYILTDNEKDSISIKYKIKKKSEVKPGEEIGEALVKLGDKTIHKENIYIKNKS